MAILREIKTTLFYLMASCLLVTCNSTNRLIIKKEEKVFTADQIKEKLSKVRTGADFPVLAKDLKDIGVTYYETRMQDGGSLYHGKSGYELLTGPNYETISVADVVNLEQLKLNIVEHQLGKTDYFQISKQCAENGIDKWAVCLQSMTCTYIDKKGNNIWVENIPDLSTQIPVFTNEQIKTAHSKVKSGADFPAYIQDLKKLGVVNYETFVLDGHTNYSGAGNYKISSSPKYDTLFVADDCRKSQFMTELKAHQQGKTDFPAFIKMCASVGVEKWIVSIDKMTCTYFDKAGREILVEQVPQ